MDSCHIFNFLFGSPRTATSELRKRFAAASRKKSPPPPACKPKQPDHSSPRSPLKQIQLKLASLTASSSKSSVFCSSASHSAIQLEPPTDSTGHTEGPQFGSDTSETQLACGVFEAQLVRLHDGAHEYEQDKFHDKSWSPSGPGQLGAELGVDENNNIPWANRDEYRAPIEENPANNLEHKRRPHLYDNPLEQDSEQASQGQENNNPIQPEGPPGEGEPVQQHSDTNRRRLSKSERVRNLVQSFEITTQAQDQRKPPAASKPVRVEPGAALQRSAHHKRPPDTPRKSTRARCLNWQLILNKPTRVSSLFQDATFLTRHFFDKLEPLDRCSAAQVCRQWRNLLYANKTYWKDLVGVIDCTQLRREHLVECIMSTLQSAKLKQQLQLQVSQRQQQQFHSYGGQGQDEWSATKGQDLCQLDQDEVWRIQELCNRFTTRGQPSHQHHATGQTHTGAGNQRASLISSSSSQDPNEAGAAGGQQAAGGIANSKSSSSQISSSTLSSVSISSLLSPLSESSRIESIRERLYLALDERGFDAVCLFGATDDDIDDLASKTRPNGAQRQIRVGRLSNCSLSDRGLEALAATFAQLEELELTGCNELTNAIDLRGLRHLRRLTITDCVNIADGFAQRLAEIVHQLEELTVQGYHLTDAFLEFVALNADTSRLRRLGLPNCKEITNDSALIIAHHFHNLQWLSVSGSAKINDHGVERLAERLKRLAVLDLGWLKIGDYALECLACDSRDLQELVLDRNPALTDAGIAYLASLDQLEALSVRWCPQLTDKSLRCISALRSLKRLSLAGLHQVTGRGLLSLLDARQLEELELTNCPAVTSDLQTFLATKMPHCNVVY